MNFGDCPYDDCDGTISEVVPERTPAYVPGECETCGRTYWYRVSRMDPWAMTEADFLGAYDVDMDARTIVKKE